MGATFKTNPIPLKALLAQCDSGELQLPDFQRSWVWDEERIRGLLASISQAFPVGAIMTLGFRLDQQLGRKPAWKALIRAKAAVLHDLGFRIDTLGAPFLDVRISTADLAAAARNGRYDEAMGPVEDALKIIGEAEPVLTRLIDEFRSTR